MNHEDPPFDLDEPPVLWPDDFAPDDFDDEPPVLFPDHDPNDPDCLICPHGHEGLSWAECPVCSSDDESVSWDSCANRENREACDYACSKPD